MHLYPQEIQVINNHSNEVKSQCVDTLATSQVWESMFTLWLPYRNVWGKFFMTIETKSFLSILVSLSSSTNELNFKHCVIPSLSEDSQTYINLVKFLTGNELMKLTTVNSTVKQTSQKNQ